MTFNTIKLYLGVFVATSILSLFFVFVEKQNLQFELGDSKGLSEKTVHLLKQLKDDKQVVFTVFSRQDSIITNKIKKFFYPFKAINPSLKIEFVDPTTNPSDVKKYGITMQGEMVVSFQDQSQLKKINVTELSESAISNSLLRLINQTDEWVVFAENFGMKTIGDESDTGLSQLLIQLKKNGFNIARMSLNNSIVLPENVKLLILAKPVEILSSEMVGYITQLMENGMSLLWLDDVDANQVSLELALGSLSGDKVMIEGEKSSAYLSKFPQHAITQNFNQPIFIAEAKEIVLDGADVFIANDNNKTIAVAQQLSKSRLIIVGDSDFVSNQYLKAAANKSMIERMVDWLLYHDNRINIPVQINQNTQLFLTQTQLIVMSVVLLLLIPLFFLFMAFKWWRKNCAQS